MKRETMQGTQYVKIVVMGVAGCGKSEVGQRLAARLGLPLIEGDTFHCLDNVTKMRDGVPLTDADREGWLITLGEQLAGQRGAVLACSALRRSYRDILRGFVNTKSSLYFLFLNINEATSEARVAARADHFYPASLVASQFATLENPSGEPCVLTLDGTLPLDVIATRAIEWLQMLSEQSGVTEAHTTSGNSYAKP